MLTGIIQSCLRFKNIQERASVQEAQPFFPRLEDVLPPCEFGKQGDPPVSRGWRPQDLGTILNSTVNLLCELGEIVSLQTVRLSEEKRKARSC